MSTLEHQRYESTEFDYEGCVVCDANGDTLGWPCPAEQARRATVDAKRRFNRDGTGPTDVGILS